MNLVIVESPTKAKTISKFLGRDYTVKSSYGHIRDLPKSKLGIDIEHNFKPIYIIPQKAKKIASELKKDSQKAAKVILATDEDREGEAIAWHLAQILDLLPSDSGDKPSAKSKTAKRPTLERIAFHEVTEKAIRQALQNSRQINMNLVEAQQARRILDRLVGYKLSPFLWKKIAKGLSAGRVQSAALRLIMEREKEIQNFKSQEYWSIAVLLKKINGADSFEALLFKVNSQTLTKLAITDQQEAEKIINDLGKATYKVSEVEKKEIMKNPLPPFTTSTLQQAAWQKLRFSARQTMRLAQQLYEGINLGEKGPVGLITYMRTDSQNLSEDFLNQAKSFIAQNIGQKYALDAPRRFKTKSKLVQEAHEAIRPADPNQAPEKIKNFLDPQQYKLYQLIWARALACQMTPAILNSLRIDIAAKNYLFRATGSTIKFDGFLKIYDPGKLEEKSVILPPLAPNEILELIKLSPQQHFTQPPARYSEATLIKTLEEHGIGRPSTYAPILGTLQERNYVNKNEEKKLQPTEIGHLVDDLLIKHFPKVVDLEFTARLENDLDQIAIGQKKGLKVIADFYEPFAANLQVKEKEVIKFVEETDKICPECNKKLIIRFSRNGKFYGCSGFPQCRHTESLSQSVKTIGLKCPRCPKGDIIEKITRKGKIFYGCSQYPQCDFASWDKPLDQKCPDCGNLLVETKSKKIKCPLCDQKTAKQSKRPKKTNHNSSSS